MGADSAILCPNAISLRRKAIHLKSDALTQLHLRHIIKWHRLCTVISGMLFPASPWSFLSVFTLHQGALHPVFCKFKHSRFPSSYRIVGKSGHLKSHIFHFTTSQRSLASKFLFQVPVLSRLAGIVLKVSAPVWPSPRHHALRHVALWAQMPREKSRFGRFFGDEKRLRAPW